MATHSHPTRILHTTIAVPLAIAYDFAHRPENFPKWAAGLSSDLHRAGEQWVAQTPAGQAIVRFSAPNAHGVLDHWVALPGKAEIYIPLRMISNGDGTEVVFMLFRQPDMSDAAFASDAATVAADLDALKSLLEKSLKSED